ncbi:MAG: hypothetical protein JWP34_5411 [Massilia sp.]|jgi:hypothetical protein|nr:hypothetical protein [Massilia sp.]
MYLPSRAFLGWGNETETGNKTGLQLEGRPAAHLRPAEFAAIGLQKLKMWQESQKLASMNGTSRSHNFRQEFRIDKKASLAKVRVVTPHPSKGDNHERLRRG